MRASLLLITALPFACSGIEDTGLEESASWSGLRKGAGGVNGDSDYCNGAILCSAGEGDCDSNTQCETGLLCGRDNGASFGFPSNFDVCVTLHCTNHVTDSGESGIDCGGECGSCGVACTNQGMNGDTAFCSTSCPCGQGQGDCDADYECQSGLVCARNAGTRFGMPNDRDVCVAAHCTNGVSDGNETTARIDCGGDCGACDCSNPIVGSECTRTCPCAFGQGDCDSDLDCQSGLRCEHAVGAQYGLAPSYDVCTMPFPPQPDIERVSVDSSGSQANDHSFQPQLSADSRTVVFYSRATNLVAGDTNMQEDVFIHHTGTSLTTRVSLSSSGAEGNGRSLSPGISEDGNIVIFHSDATNLVPNDTNNATDLFVRDLRTSQTMRVSVGTNGTEGDGGTVGFGMSADGRYVVFSSASSNLVTGDNNGFRDVFVHDRQTMQTMRVSVDSSGAEGNGHSDECDISDDGRFVAFASLASNLVAGDTNGQSDIFLHDRQNATTVRLSVSSSGVEANNFSYVPRISGDGSAIVFHSQASNLVSGDTNNRTDLFVRDRVAGTTTRESVRTNGTQSGGDSLYGTLSYDGRYVTFHSSGDLVGNGPGQSASHYIYVRDRSMGRTESAGTLNANDDSLDPFIARDGRFIAFCSRASNLVSGDTNTDFDVFVKDNPL